MLTFWIVLSTIAVSIGDLQHAVCDEVFSSPVGLNDRFDEIFRNVSAQCSGVYEANCNNEIMGTNRSILIPFSLVMIQVEYSTSLLIHIK